MIKFPTENESKIIFIAISFIGSWVLAFIVFSMLLNNDLKGYSIFTVFFLLTSFRSGVAEFRSRWIKSPLFVFAHLLPMVIIVACGILITIKLWV
ncbi:hypothetical protein LCGC14_0924880 [marine sediment metagenome]|uniref:Uncharacterized protein n=1 Tax=marine sediment metagenome TaxID=412755 RepID=A0A0F9NUI5_9ZZZZ